MKRPTVVQALQKLRAKELQAGHFGLEHGADEWSCSCSPRCVPTEKLKDLPFIMITAESKTENVIAAKEAGVSNYIVKPFNAATLKSKLVTVLGNF